MKCTSLRTTTSVREYFSTFHPFINAASFEGWFLFSGFSLFFLCLPFILNAAYILFHLEFRIIVL